MPRQSSKKNTGDTIALLRDRPYSNSNFLVDFGDGNAWAASGGFSEVIFPEFVIPSGKRTTAPRAPVSPADSIVERQRTHLILKRGALGSLDLYDWWNKARLGKAPKGRMLTIHLLADDQRTVVMSWRFTNVRPVALAYSPLRASETGVLIETLELAFDRMEMG
jgi:phage tail-like protein